MKVDGQHYRSIWFDEAAQQVRIIDQRWLPHEFRVVPLLKRSDFATAIRDMWVRGAPLIGATAAYGVAVHMQTDPSDASLNETWEVLHETRPTAINLRWALDGMRELLRDIPEAERAGKARAVCRVLVPGLPLRVGKGSLGLLGSAGLSAGPFFLAQLLQVN